jgi:hypothetical protein
MFHACVKRFDVIGGRGNILGWDGEVNEALYVFITFFPPHQTSRLLDQQQLEIKFTQ